MFEGYAPTGFPGLSAFEDTRSFPYLDFNVMSSLLTKLGLWRLLAEDNPEGFRRFLQFRLHPNFPEFVRAKDRLLYALASAAIEIYKASEQLVKTTAGGIAMPDALTWKGQHLIVTATDLEDRVLQKVLDVRGFSAPVVVHDERFSYIERFRADVGRVFHLRTSAGSGDASGAFIMGKNAIDRLNPKYVISAGICFGLQESKQRLGDVVVSEMIHDYEKQRVSKERPEDRGRLGKVVRSF